MSEKKYIVCSSYHINNYIDMESYRGNDAFHTAIINSYMDWYDESFYLFITKDKKSYGIIQRDLIDIDSDNDLPELRDSDPESDITECEDINMDPLDYTTTKSTYGCEIIYNPKYFLKNQRITGLISLMINSGDILVEQLFGWGWRQVLVFDGNSPPKKYE